MTPAQIDFELAYWRATPREAHAERYRKILDAWGLRAVTGSVLEVGTGPLGGVLPLIEAPRKVGLDPLFLEYGDAGLLARHADIEYVPVGIEEFETEERFAAVVSMNALDHGACSFCAIDRIEDLLAPGGRFYLHVHLRRPDQLNVGHDHALSEEQLQGAIERNYLTAEMFEVWDRDPIEGAPYKTAIGVWAK